MEKKNTTPNTDEFHLGIRIRAELKHQGRTITWLADEIHCTRENLYKVFRHPWINTDMLFKISEAMHHDFFRDCSDWLKCKRE